MLNKLVDFVCRKCSSFIDSTEVHKKVTLDDDVIEKATKFSHLGDVLSSGGVHEAVIARIRLDGKS